MKHTTRPACTHDARGSGGGRNDRTHLDCWVRELVRARFDADGWSLRTLARAAGVPHCTIYRYLAGSEIRSSALLEILAAIGLDLVDATPAGASELPRLMLVGGMPSAPDCPPELLVAGGKA